MARKFTRVSKDAFDQMQTQAGLILTKFDPSGSQPINDSDIAFPTTGGISVSAVPSYTDNGADVDNVPNNTMELKELTGWDVKISTTSLGVTPAAIKMALGAADTSAVMAQGKTSTVTPRSVLKTTDFMKELWWVGDRVNGGMVAAKLTNVLSTGGLQLKTAKNGKGQITIELTAHVSVAAIDTVPVEFYISDAAGVSA